VIGGMTLSMRAAMATGRWPIWSALSAPRCDDVAACSLATAAWIDGLGGRSLIRCSVQSAMTTGSARRELMMLEPTLMEVVS
jgi:hypothetical protein